MENTTLHVMLSRRPLGMPEQYSTAHATMLLKRNRKTPSRADFSSTVLPIETAGDFYARLGEQNVSSGAVGLLIPWHNPNLVREVISLSPCDVSVTAEDTELLDEIFGRGSYSKLRVALGRPILVEHEKGSDGAGFEIAPERRKDCAPQIEYVISAQPMQLPASWERVYLGGNKFEFVPKK